VKVTVFEGRALATIAHTSYYRNGKTASLGTLQSASAGAGCSQKGILRPGEDEDYYKSDKPARALLP
jgi:hypothetical protein